MGLNYNPTIVPDGLILYLDPANSRSYSGSGNTWYDLSGNSLNATLVNSPSYTVSNRGTFVLDGSSNYFTLPNNSILSLSEFTISIWVKALQLNADQYLIDTSSNLNYGYGYSFRIRSNNTIRFWAYDANTLVDTTDTITSNIWYHITVSYSNFTKTQRIYINGSLSASAQHTNAFVLADPQYLRIGHSQVLGGYSKAVIGQSIFYNRELSASEIKQNYDASKGRFSTPENIVTNGLVLNFDSSKANSYSGVGNTIYDLSGFGNTGTLTNGPTFSGLNGGSIVFDGSNDYINVTNGFTNLLKNKDYWSIGLWVKLLSQTAGEPVLISAGPSIGYYDLFLEVANNAIYFAAGRGSNTGYIQNTNVSGTLGYNLTTNYFNIVFVKDGSTTGYVYVNSINIPMSVVGLGLSSMPNINEDMRIGTFKQSGFELHGNIAQVQMYNRALSAQEILQNYNATKSRFGL